MNKPEGKELTMQGLSKVLADTLRSHMEPRSVSSSLPTVGSVTVTGTMSTLPSQRPENLTESQLTAIQSKLLQQMPSVTLSSRKKYGKKLVKDEYGQPFLDENAVVGTEEYAEVGLCCLDSVSDAILVSALRPSPVNGCVAHLTRLALHKRLGSTPEDRTLLLNDYGENLRNYPEFAIYLACRWFWENDDSDFAPNLGKLRAVVEGITDRLYEFQRRRANPPKLAHNPLREQKPLHRNEKPRSAWTAQDWQDHVGDANKMVRLAEANPEYFNVEEWKAEVARREAEAAKAAV